MTVGLRKPPDEARLRQEPILLFYWTVGVSFLTLLVGIAAVARSLSVLTKRVPVPLPLAHRRAREKSPMRGGGN